MSKFKKKSKKKLIINNDYTAIDYGRPNGSAKKTVSKSIIIKGRSVGVTTSFYGKPPKKKRYSAQNIRQAFDKGIDQVARNKLSKKLAQYEVDDASFVDDLLNSQSHVFKVGHWLMKCGYEPEIAEVHVRDCVENMNDYSDDGDLFIEGNRLEAKQRMLNFDSQESFPYPTIIVDVAHTWDRAEQKPLAYILTNKSVTCCLVVLGSTFESWKKINKWDRFKKRYRTFYECPITETLFYRMDNGCELEWLKKEG